MTTIPPEDYEDYDEDDLEDDVYSDYPDSIVVPD